MMQKRTLWIIVGLSILTYLFFQINSLYYSDSYRNIGQFVRSTAFGFIGVIIRALILGSLVALIPYNKQKFRQRLQTTFPIFIIILFLVFNIILGSNANFSRSSGEKISKKEFQKFKTPTSVNCNAVHNGYFEFEHLITERNGEDQTHINRRTDVTSFHKVRWISACEYELINPHDDRHSVLYKIINVTKDGYECYANDGIFIKKMTFKRLEMGL